jgi:hypothetical protein
MDIWTIIENVQIPSYSPCGITVFLYHKYTCKAPINALRFKRNPLSSIVEFDLKIIVAPQIPTIDRDYMMKSIQIYD